MNRRFTPVAILSLLLTALPASGQVYSWKDKEGRIHYGDMPPAGVGATLLHGRQAGSAPPARTTGEGRNPVEPPAPVSPASSRSLAEREQAFRERRAAQAEAEAKQAEEAAAKSETERFCTSAQHELAALRAGQRMVRFNVNGEREFLDDQARAEQATRLERQIAERCK